MTVEEHIDYWKNLAESDFEFASQLLKDGKKLHYCLFFGHLGLEKLLKALIVAVTNETPPKIHNLVKLSRKANLTLDEELKKKLDDFNTFNLEARYPDYKLSFYKLCTPEFTSEKFSQIEEVFKWLKNQFPQK